MSAGTYNFSIEQGATFSKQFVWKNNAGTPIDLSSYTEIRLMARLKYTDTATVISLSIGSGITVTDAVNGIFDIFMSATATTALTFSTAKYDLELVDGDGVVTRLLEGNIFLSKEVTK